VNGTAIALGGSGTITATATGTLTIGSGLGGTSYNGSTGVTITNTGVTSVVAGTNIAVSGATGAVTVSVTGTVPTATSATTAGTVTTAAQGNITSVGTLTSLTVSGALSSGAHTITGSPLAAIINGGTNGVGNIGSAAGTFNTVFAKATTAQYADLAENYSADAKYEPGTVVEFGGSHEVTVSNTAGSATVAGVVTTNPAYLMNSHMQADHVAGIALMGRVPVNVIGAVRKGQMMVSAGNGHAMACTTPTLGSVIGKALEDFNGESGTIEVVVGRL
jgi:hypothetical protein